MDRGKLVMVGMALDAPHVEWGQAINKSVPFFPRPLFSDQLIALPGMRQTRTFFVMKEVVDNAPLEL